MKGSTYSAAILLAGICALSGCGAQPGAPSAANSTTNPNSNTNISNVNVGNTNSAAPSSAVSEAKEPEKYQALVKLNFEAIGEQRNASLPTVTATVARNGGDRRMEFTLPTGEKVIYLDTVGSNYVILPNRRQFAELTKESVGFDIRRLLMPEQIVNQVTNMQGVERVGEETLNGRQVIKYRYAATANTQSSAGQVATESYLLIDAESGLPLRSETVSQSQTGGNVQGYKGMRIVTEMSDISMEPDPNLFTVPADYAKVDAEQVKAQAALVFQAVAALLSQAAQQTTTPVASPTVAR